MRSNWIRIQILTNLMLIMLFDDKLSDIIRTLENDGVLLHATDTVWGLACSALSQKGISSIYKIKKRDPSKPILMLVDSLDMLKKYVPHIHPRIDTLLHFHTKPLTVVYPHVQKLPNYALAPDGSAAIRITSDPYCNNIIRLLGSPLMSTSANISDEPVAARFDDLDHRIVNNVDFVSRHRRNEKLNGRPSVMINYDAEGEINFLRM